MKKGRTLRVATIPGAFILSILGAGQAQAIDLREAVQIAVATNPEINQAARNKEAIEFERKQGQGLYGPRISVEASAGARRLENATRRSLNIANDTLYPLEADLVAEQLLVDFGRARSEVKRQAARTDGAALRVEERAEFVALNVARSYIDYMLQQRIVAAAEDNVTFHERLTGDLRQGVTQGSISIADQQQAEERLQASRVTLTEAREEMQNASISFRQLTGVDIGQPSMPPDLRAQSPGNVEEAVDLARTQNPRVLEALADIDASHAQVSAAKAELAPRISLEGRIRAGEDIDGFRGTTEDYMGRVILKWNVFDSGINRNTINEMQSRESESVFRLHQVAREAEADVRTAWNRVENQTRLVGELEQQGRVSDDLLLSYREQFNVGRRSLLDVLDAQNTRVNVQVQTETARLAQLYAQYRVLAASNRLLEALGVNPPPSAVANARQRFKVKSVAAEQVMEPKQTYTVSP
jgi:outer membrane protein, adhesin transport system